MVRDLLKINRKRTFEMFERENEDHRLPEIESLIKQKVRLKMHASYNDIGKVPGVALDSIKRAKILKDLNVTKREE